MALQIFTGKINQYKGPNGIDITVKTIDPLGQLLAPTWAMVMPIINARKYGRSPDKWAQLKNEYIKQYQEILNRIDENHPDFIKTLLDKPYIVLLCYCERLRFCHRDLVAHWLVKKGANYGGWLE